MTQQEPTHISPLLDELTCELIGLCLDALAEGGDLPVTIACATGTDDITFRAFDDDGPEAALAAARETIREESASITAYAVAYDGFIRPEEDDEPLDALLVEFGERGMTTAFSAYVAYRRGRSPEEFRAAEPLAAGEEPLLLSDADNE